MPLCFGWYFYVMTFSLRAYNSKYYFWDYCVHKTKTILPNRNPAISALYALTHSLDRPPQEYETWPNLNSPVADAGVFALDVLVVFCTSRSLLVCFAITRDPVRGFPSGSLCGSESTLTNVLRDLVKTEVTEPISAEQPSADWTSALERQLHAPWLWFRHCHFCLVLIKLWYKAYCVLWARIMCWTTFLYSVQSMCESFCQTEAMEPAEISSALSREKRAVVTRIKLVWQTRVSGATGVENKHL